MLSSSVKYYRVKVLLQAAAALALQTY